jgi:membrane-bound lytic murein transglycosylase A
MGAGVPERAQRPSTPHRIPGGSVAAAVAALALWVAGCAQAPVMRPAEHPAATGVPASRIARWTPVEWSQLPGWSADAVGMAWPALWRSCARPAAGWAQACASARGLGQALSEAQARDWLQTHLQPYRIEAIEGGDTGRLTGYFEPTLRGSRQRHGAYTVPLYAPPADLATRKPWWTRAQMQTEPAAQAALAGKELVWVADPLDAMLLQVQGSGRIALEDAQGRSEGSLRLAFAGHNDQPFRPLSSWLVNQGELPLAQANGDAIRSWAAAHPARVQEMLNANPRVIFFQAQSLLDASVGPAGSQGVPLTPGRSLAVDRESIPLGTPVWIDSTEPDKWQPQAPPARPLQRLMVAQDTGSAIKGAVRADYFWGWGEGADVVAGRTRQPLRLWALWPRP